MSKPDKARSDRRQFTPRNVTKVIVSGVVRYKVAVIVANLADDYTRFDKDDMFVKIGSGVVAWGVADAAEPLTDKLVDTTFDFAGKQVANYKSRREAKKVHETIHEKK